MNVQHPFKEQAQLEGEINQCCIYKLIFITVQKLFIQTKLNYVKQ